jgi:hypothetical protein
MFGQGRLKKRLACPKGDHVRTREAEKEVGMSEPWSYPIRGLIKRTKKYQQNRQLLHFHLISIVCVIVGVI